MMSEGNMGINKNSESLMKIKEIEEKIQKLDRNLAVLEERVNQTVLVKLNKHEKDLEKLISKIDSVEKAIMENYNELEKQLRHLDKMTQQELVKFNQYLSEMNIRIHNDIDKIQKQLSHIDAKFTIWKNIPLIIIAIMQFILLVLKIKEMIGQ